MANPSHHHKTPLQASRHKDFLGCKNQANNTGGGGTLTASPILRFWHRWRWAQWWTVIFRRVRGNRSSDLLESLPAECIQFLSALFEGSGTLVEIGPNGLYAGF